MPEPSHSWPRTATLRSYLGTLLIILPAPGEASEILVLFHHHDSPPPLLPSGSSSLALGSPLQESQLSLGGQRCVGEPDEELASAFPVFIRNAVLGQKQPKRAKAEPCRSTDAVSMASHKWQVPALSGGGEVQGKPAPWPISLARSLLPSALGKDRLRWTWRSDKIHPTCILVP